MQYTDIGGETDKNYLQMPTFQNSMVVLTRVIMVPVPDGTVED